MQNRRVKRGITLLATTSVVALGLSGLPVALDYDLGVPVLKVAQADSCCFTGETRVLLADGSWRAISEVAVGDRVMAPGGGANRVIGIERPRLGSRPLYRLNGGPAFVTGEHPFLTTSGWRAVDPAATRAETPGLVVGRLEPGARLRCLRAVETAAVSGALALAPAIALCEEERLLMALAAEPAPAETWVYNLLLDGDHSYIAEGYIVHNKGGDGGGEGGEGGDGGGGEGGGEGGDSGGDGGGEGGESGHDGGGHDSDDGHVEGGELGDDEHGEFGDDEHGGLDDDEHGQQASLGEHGDSGESGDDEQGELGEDEVHHSPGHDR